jgi:hypothetical protein
VNDDTEPDDGARDDRAAEMTLRPAGLGPLPAPDHRIGSDTMQRADEGESLDSALTTLPFSDRYDARHLLGRGGMGEVRLVRDHTVGRDVAMKVIGAQSDESRRMLQRRFVREARVQGQLEHPAIVPVYDFGVDPEGALYFTMKRIRGSSLADIVAALREGDAAVVHRYSQRRLLTLFGQVCMAVHFANEKGVVHRDLKPANIMLGSFGEVYVLDWGLAKLHGDPPVAVDERLDLGHDRPSLATGVAGTLGYMAPEQLEPPYEVDARADIYALGAMLFELLTLERMHSRATPIEMLASTLMTDGVDAGTRAPDRAVPPELERLCKQATRLAPDERLPSAEAIATAIDAYLDGDRDLALRRELARVHALRAEAALDASMGAPEAEADDRARAMREVAAALALDATHRGARTTLVRLITEPPRNIPAEASAEIERGHRRAYQIAGRAGMGFYLGYLLYLPLLLWMGVRDMALFSFGWITIALCALTTYVLLRHPPKHVNAPLAHLAVSTFAVGAVSVMFGPFVLVPMLALGNAVAYMSSVGHARGLVPLATCLAVVVPQALRWAGILPDNYVFADGSWTILPSVFYIRPIATQVFLLVAIVGTLVPACLFVARLRQAFTEAELRLQLQAWQLRQIVPEAEADAA